MPQDDPAFGDAVDDPQSVEHIARRVVELLQRDLDSPGLQLIDTETVARRMTVSEDWVRAHAAELGAIRVGDGAKGTLRFEITRVRAALWRRRIQSPRSPRPSRHPTRQEPGSAHSGLIPDDVKDW